MTEEDNRLIAEALGIHEFIPSGKDKEMSAICEVSKDWRLYHNPIPDFSTWPGFGVIMERGPEREWWLHFLCFLQKDIHPDGPVADVSCIHYKQINPPVMSSKLVEFLMERKRRGEEK
jgi:hypothetical protein